MPTLFPRVLLALLSLSALTALAADPLHGGDYAQIENAANPIEIQLQEGNDPQTGLPGVPLDAEPKPFEMFNLRFGARPLAGPQFYVPRAQWAPEEQAPLTALLRLARDKDSPLLQAARENHSLPWTQKNLSHGIEVGRWRVQLKDARRSGRRHSRPIARSTS